MKSRHPSVCGYSMVEMMVSLAIVIIAVTAATGGWLFVVRGETLNATQMKLDLEVRKTMERLRRDLRLSSIDKIFFYPPGPGPYSAICFPMAHDDDGDGIVEMTDDGIHPAANGSNILWDTTVIYHVFTGTPYRLIQTTFNPRDNSLSDAQRVEQIASVVQSGHGKNTYGSSNAASHELFANLFTWSIAGKGAAFDGYSPTLMRENFPFGSILLTPGSHDFTFSSNGRNALSSSYYIGLDSVVVSPSGDEREGEAQTPTTQTGATAQRDYRMGGSWSGNYQLLFPAATSNTSFTLNLENDRWEETNFRGLGAICKRTIVYWDEYASPRDFVVKLEGCDYNWDVAAQTGSTNVTDIADNSLTNCAYRVLIRGGEMESGSNLRFDGRHVYFLFYSATAAPLKIKHAFIAPADSSTNYTVNATATGTPILFGSSESIMIGANSYCFGYTDNFVIEKSKSYLVTFLVDDFYGNARSWEEMNVGAPGCYRLLNASKSDLSDANWSSKAIEPTNRVFALAGLYTLYPTNGLFTSQILDTKLAAPVYSTISWSAEKPSGTSLKIKVRTGDQSNLSDAQAWSNITGAASGGTISPGARRFIQFQADMDPDSGGWNTPKLKDVTIKWAGETKVVDVAAIMTKGPNYGLCELSVDGKPLLRGLKINLKIFEDIPGWGRTTKQVTSEGSVEVEPRNTGK